MELDLNEEPLDQIEERIRRLEGIIFRARQRQRWRQSRTPIQITSFAGELITPANVEDEGGRVRQEEVGMNVEGGVVESGNTGKRKATYLLAKALGMETYTNEAEGCTGSFFDCNICLDMARDPVLTCCGHLFCWPCFYRLPYAYSNAKECPVCKGEVTETGIIPIYGNASVNNSDDQLELKETGCGIPARPRARRVESIRQQFRNQGASAAIQDMAQLRFGNFIGGLREQVQFGVPNTATDRTNVLAAQSRHETSNDQHTSSRRISRLLVQGAASFSSLSSAISSAVDSAERLFEELESYIHSRSIGSIRQLNPRPVNRDTHLNIATSIQSESRNEDVAVTSSAATFSVSPLSRNDDINAATHSNIWTTDSSTRGISSNPSSSSRTDVLR